MSLAAAINPKNDSPAFKPLGIKKGLHEAGFVGMGEPFEKYDYFKGCKNCGVKNEKGEILPGVGCTQCEGTGKLKGKYVLLNYDIDGVIESEEMSYKLSAPGQTSTGKSLSPSTLFLRMRTFFDKHDPNTQAIAYDEFEKAGKPLPVTLMVDDNQSGKATKIKAVMLRETK